jgi:phosphoglycolate phosphatase-like HAD superfamily hydrolase
MPNPSPSTAIKPHVVWDWNGTLFADGDLTVAAANVALARFGAGPITRTWWREHAARPIQGTYFRAVGRDLSPTEWRQVQADWIARYTAGLKETALSDGARQALDTFAAQGWSQAIVSMHPLDHVLADVAAAGLTRYFSQIAAPGFDHQGAPKAELLAKHLLDCGIEPDQAVMIGDLPDDGAAASQVGLRAVLVATGDSSRARLEATGLPVVDNLYQAVDLIQALTWPAPPA